MMMKIKIFETFYDVVHLLKHLTSRRTRVDVSAFTDKSEMWERSVGILHDLERFVCHMGMTLAAEL
jgi:hypothetical protein